MYFHFILFSWFLLRPEVSQKILGQYFSPLYLSEPLLKTLGLQYFFNSTKLREESCINNVFYLCLRKILGKFIETGHWLNAQLPTQSPPPARKPHTTSTSC